MKSEKKKKIITVPTIIIIFLILPILFISPIQTFSPTMDNEETESINDKTIIFSEVEENNELLQKNTDSLPIINNLINNKDNKLFLRADQNQNGISDEFEDKLNLLASQNSTQNIVTDEDASSPIKNTNQDLFNDKQQIDEKISLETIPVIINFDSEDYSTKKTLFENLGGEIKSEYNSAIKGFAGVINYDGLSEFRQMQIKDGIPFLIEEDTVAESNLYYASRNMNLRPYVWNNLSYSGDPYGSIAIVDSGIDDSHNFFSPGYSNGNFNYKIVGWRDEVNGGSTPYDDNGHGTHCGGIAAGLGSPTLDELERVVSTETFVFKRSFDYPEDYDFNTQIATFYVTEAGTVEVNCEYEDFTPGADQVNITATLYHNDTVVESYTSSSNSWTYKIEEDASGYMLENYSLQIGVDFDDNTGDGMVDDPYFRFRAEIHWPFNPPRFNSGDPWKGVANNTHLVGVKVMNNRGSGWTSDIINGIEWVINNKEVYNITTMSLSLGGGSGHVSMINAVNNAVENGIVTVVSAGNGGGSSSNRIGSPGDADNVITVAAMNNADEVTSYSSSGGPSYTEETIKPDIMAPGGSYYEFEMFSADTNDNDGGGEYSTDKYSNDLYQARGTSMSAPAVAGATNLIIQAMGGHQNWNYTATEAKRVKSLLLMTATETYPLKRETNPTYSPELNRGGKDRQEGYGRINVDAGIEAYVQELHPKSYIDSWLTSSLINPYNKHALGCFVSLNASENYKFSLDVPTGADFDLYMYSYTPTSIGDPILIASSISSELGKDEDICITSSLSGKYFLVAKAISGQGYANISYIFNENPATLTDESVKPSAPRYQSTLLNFTVNYTDPDNIAPSYINLYINNSAYLMTKSAYLDNNYVDGCLYQFSTYLQPGTYEYYFECKDGRFSDSTIIYTDLVIQKTNNNDPILSDGNVSPSVGLENRTIFEFSVNYTDPDNNAAENVNITIESTNYTMIKLDSTDVNYMDGAIFVFNITLNKSKVYSYNFTCFDGNRMDFDGSYSGPIVNYMFKLFEEDFESDLSKWDYISGLWHLTDESSDYPNPSHSPTHSMWYGQESTGNYNTGSDNYGFLWSKPIDLSVDDNAYLEFYNWQEIGYYSDLSYIYLFTEEEANLIYYCFDDISPWEKVSLNISEYCGEGFIEILFLFSADDEFNNYRGWLIDDILIYSENEPNHNPPNLTYDQVNPISGDQTTKLNFSVIYTDIDNNYPRYINTVINGTSYPMEKQDPIDKNYTDGCVYQFITYLQPGEYNYSFECYDRKFTNSTVVITGLIIDKKDNLNIPNLSTGQVNPYKGYKEEDTFTFSINYTDLDNNAPLYVTISINSMIYSMVKQNWLDSNYMDGCIYIYETEFDETGTYSFYFNCSDGYSTTNYGPCEGPNVINQVLQNYHMIPNHVFNWINASEDGIRCDLDGKDDANQIFYLPFLFEFYDDIYDSMFVYTNGFICFENESAQSSYYNQPFPTYSYELMIAPFWADLEADSPCNIFVKNMTNPDCVIIQWENYYYLGGSDLVGSFQVILYENGDIVFNYDYLNYVSQYTCGLNFGDELEYYNSYQNLRSGMDNFSILFKYEPNPIAASGGGDDDDDDDEIDIILIITVVTISSAVGVAIGASIGFIKHRKSKLFRERVLKSFRDEQRSNLST